MAAIGQDGRWVIIQFKTATLDTGDTWTSDRSDLGPERHRAPARHDGRRRYFCPALRLRRCCAFPRAPDAIGVEQAIQGRHVRRGDRRRHRSSTSRPGACAISGSARRPFSRATTHRAARRSPADGDAYLLPNDTSLSGVWAEHGGEIATWSDETDSWVYCTPAPGTIIHIGGSSTVPIPATT